MDDGCDVHGHHYPTPLRIVVHHVQPLAMGGPSLPTNEVSTCDNGHMNIHRLLDDLLAGKPMRKGGTRVERRLAQRGYDKWVAAGKPGHPVYEMEQA